MKTAQPSLLFTTPVGFDPLFLTCSRPCAGKRKSSETAELCPVLDSLSWIARRGAARRPDCGFAMQGRPFTLPKPERMRFAYVLGPTLSTEDKRMHHLHRLPYPVSFSVIQRARRAIPRRRRRQTHCKLQWNKGIDFEHFLVDMKGPQQISKLGREQQEAPAATAFRNHGLKAGH